MKDLKAFLSGLVAFLAGSGPVGAGNDSSGLILETPTTADNDGTYTRSVIFRNSRSAEGGWTLAQHSSHSSHASHASHASHYSSSGGGGTTPYPVFVPPAPPRTANPPPQVVTPVDPAAAEAAKLAMRIQLALNSRGYCECTVDGKMGPSTVEALKRFQKDNSLAASGVPDTATLEKLGISF